MNQKNKKERGITLIALVITIIVLLILAAVSIATLTGENGILNQASRAADNTKNATEKEQLQLAYNAALSKNMEGGKYTVEADDLQPELDNLGTGAEASQDGNNIDVKFPSQNQYTIEGGQITEKNQEETTSAVYAKLYTDGTLILSSSDYTDTLRELKENYGDISSKGEYSTPGWYNEEVTNVIIYNKIMPKSTSYWFDNMDKITTIDLSNLDTSNVTDMSSMFSNCSSLGELNLSNFKTDNVINMRYMFGGCSSLGELNLSNFKTDRVTDMSMMFRGCSSLSKINLSSFNTKNVIDMSQMFYDCISLDTSNNLGITNWDVSNVKTFKSMFSKEKGSPTWNVLDISNWNISDDANIESMFHRLYGDSELTVYVKDTAIKNRFENDIYSMNEEYIIKQEQ